MDLNITAENLRKNGFTVSVFKNKTEAAEYLNKEIDCTSVGCGGSVTLQEMGLLPKLRTHNVVYFHGDSENPKLCMQLAAGAQIYLMSCNAIASDIGALLNIDGTGNRLSSSLYGHQKVYLVAGKNKISPDFNSALDRLRNVVAPKNAKRLCRNTPCAKAENPQCFDCASPDRICNALTVHYKKIGSMDMEVVLIDEELGY